MGGILTRIGVGHAHPRDKVSLILLVITRTL